ncbi:MAG: polysaccharide deacetylase family protein [Pseudomonadota bacterium]
MMIKTMLNGMYYSGMKSLCAPVFQGIGSILMLHHVRDESASDFAPNAHLSVSPQFLDITLLRLKQEGYRFVSLTELADKLKRGEFDQSEKPMICVTLDDGYRDNLENAAPIFRRHDVPYTIYVAPGMFDGTHTIWWEDLETVIRNNSRIATGIPGHLRNINTSTADEKDAAFRELMNYLTKQVSEADQRQLVASLCKAHGHDAERHLKTQVMNWSELKKLAQDPLCTIGAHTLGHYAVARLDNETSEAEIKGSREVLEKKLSIPVEHFAYPYGNENSAGKRDFDIANKLAYTTAVTTRHGVVYPEHADHMMALPRISLNGSFQALRYVRTLLSGLPTRMSNRGKKLNVA